MTFEDIENSLPNGFHDSKILYFSLDAKTRTLTMRFSLWVGSMDDLNPEVYREIALTAQGISIFFVEPPDPTYPFSLDGQGLAAQGDFVDVKRSRFVSEQAGNVLKKLPSRASIYRFFLENWNSFLYVAAEEVSFSWI